MSNISSLQTAWEVVYKEIKEFNNAVANSEFNNPAEMQEIDEQSNKLDQKVSDLQSRISSFLSGQEDISSIAEIITDLSEGPAMETFRVAKEMLRPNSEELVIEVQVGVKRTPNEEGHVSKQLKLDDKKPLDLSEKENVLTITEIITAVSEEDIETQEIKIEELDIEKFDNDLEGIRKELKDLEEENVVVANIENVEGSPTKKV